MDAPLKRKKEKEIDKQSLPIVVIHDNYINV